MSDNLVFLAHRSDETVDEGTTFIACKVCRNKTYTLTCPEPEAFPLMTCAACGAEIGRVGWADDEPDDDVPNEAAA